MSGLDGACGASIPPGCDPAGARLGGPIDPGGRGMLSNPGGVCAKAREPKQPHATHKVAASRRLAGPILPITIMPRLRLKIGRIQAVDPMFVSVSLPW